ncbi:tRNA 2-selenouridine(34) synthase MnmH [Alphaproteobacteria bacterium]|nr:tRNA 2-selenouridine(34) synthase MnmH [Alphaproteobacteria bacterium]
MRINKTVYKNTSQQEYNIIIDVRTPLEFKEDHIPNSINYPVLTNKQRHEIGIEYKENSFLAKKVGASIISSNISKIINKIKFDKKQKILIYCWRGGLRSLSLYLVLKQIGYDVTLLDGGYKNYRRFVVKFFETSCEKYKFNQIMGVTGVGKTLFIKELSKSYQVIDFEGLANHKGSILGNIPNKNQPSQKYFETLIYEKLNSFNSRKNIWVEAESIKVGKLSIPSKIWKNMPLGKNVKVISSLEERVRFILKDYKYFTNTPTLMKEALKVLKKIIPKEEFLMIEENLKKEKYFQFVKSLIEYHYDRAYKKTRAESVSNIFNEIYLDKINLLNIKKAIKQNNYF